MSDPVSAAGGLIRADRERLARHIRIFTGIHDAAATIADLAVAKRRKLKKNGDFRAVVADAAYQNIYDLLVDLGLLNLPPTQ